MNKQKKSLLISPFFYPEPISTGKFNTDFALKLQEEGHQVTVLCSHPFYPEWKTKFSSDTLQRVHLTLQPVVGSISIVIGLYTSLEDFTFFKRKYLAKLKNFLSIYFLGKKIKYLLNL